MLVHLCHFMASAFCLLGAWVLMPVTWVEEYLGWGEGNNEALERQRRMSAKEREWKWLDGRSYAEVAKEE